MKKLNCFKNEYVKKQVLNGVFIQLPPYIAYGMVAKVDGIGSIDKNGYEVEYLYIQKGGYVKNFGHDCMVKYRVISGEDLESEVSFDDLKYEIKPFTRNTIIEVVKVKKTDDEDKFKFENSNFNDMCNKFKQKLLKIFIDDCLRNYDLLLNKILSYNCLSEQILNKVAKNFNLSSESLNKIKEMFLSNGYSISEVNISNETDNCKVKKYLPSYFNAWDGKPPVTRLVNIPGLSGSN